MQAHTVCASPCASHPLSSLEDTRKAGENSACLSVKSVCLPKNRFCILDGMSHLSLLPAHSMKSSGVRLDCLRRRMWVFEHFVVFAPCCTDRQQERGESVEVMQPTTGYWYSHLSVLVRPWFALMCQGSMAC